jgi:hypothetical protein
MCLKGVLSGMVRDEYHVQSSKTGASYVVGEA